MSVVYGIMVVVAIVLLVAHILLLRKREPWLLLMYGCIVVVNFGYLLLSLSKTVEFALFANKVAYLGSVYLCMCMFLTIVRLCGFKYKKRLPIALLIGGLVMFGIICTTGYLPWYYEEVSLTFLDGAAKLEKVYGPLHPLYVIYTVGYFAGMVTTVIHSLHVKKFASHKIAVLMIVVVFGNIAAWLVEKFIPWSFEFLSVSYLFSEVLLLTIYWMMQDISPAKPVDIATMSIEDKITKCLSVINSGEILSSREREILELVLLNKKRKEIADELCLSENTIKTYTRTLYGKLGVSSREELYALLVK